MHACKIHSKFTSSTSDITLFFEKMLSATLLISSLYSTFHYCQLSAVTAAAAETADTETADTETADAEKVTDAAEVIDAVKVEWGFQESNKNNWINKIHLFNLWLSV